MTWNKSNNNGHNNRDSWSSSSKNTDSHSNENNKEERDKKLPNLDDFFYKLTRKFSRFNNKNANSDTTNKVGHYIGFVILLTIFIIWAGSGFYTIKEAERGVVLRFGKFDHLVQPGLNWKPTFIDTVTAVNVESVRELAASGVMLTSDENIVRVEMNVQYRVTNPERYLFSVTNADYSLHQATDSALRGVIGKYTMDRILTEGRTLVRSDTQHVLEETIRPYDMGIALLDVNFQAARPPEEVKAAFDDAIAARENEQQYIREAEAYSNEVQPRANGQAQRILEEGKAYKTKTVLEAQGKVQQFLKVLPEYKVAPEITRKRLYIDTMERVLSQTRKILVNERNSNNLVVLSLDQMLRNSSLDDAKFLLKKDVPVKKLHNDSNSNTSAHDIIVGDNNNNVNGTNAIEQRRANTNRYDTKREREGRE